MTEKIEVAMAQTRISPVEDRFAEMPMAMLRDMLFDKNGKLKPGARGGAAYAAYERRMKTAGRDAVPEIEKRSV